jgi:hypothetical protein
MVRLAMQGVRVHEVDGVRFDLYSAGAVLYTMLENSFPAHGSLSRLSRRAPEALRWIVQRAMADLSSRYSSAAEMRADLAALAVAPRPFELRPADLPSFARTPAGASAPTPLASPAPRYFEPAPPASSPNLATARTRGRFVPALALAGTGLCGLFLLSTAFLFAGHDHDQGFELASVPVRDWPSLSEPERALVDLAQGVAEDLTVEEPASEPLADPTPSGGGQDVVPAPKLNALPARGRVLVLEDVTSGVDRRVLSYLAERLRQKSYSVVGGELEDGADSNATVELLAEARHALGIGRPDEPLTQMALQGFLDRTADLAALILVSRNDAETGHTYHVFVRSGAQGLTSERRSP